MTVTGLSPEGTFPRKREEKLHALLTFLESKQDGIFVLPVHSCNVAAETDTMRKKHSLFTDYLQFEVKIIAKGQLIFLTSMKL